MSDGAAETPDEEDEPMTFDEPEEPRELLPKSPTPPRQPKGKNPCLDEHNPFAN